MLTGKELGAAIASAIKKKGVRKAALARTFEISPPSIQDWIKRGTISKDKLIALIEYFKDDVGPEHWGLTERLPVANEPAPPVIQSEPWPFPDIDRGRFFALSRSEREKIQHEVREMLVAYEVQRGEGPGKLSPSRPDHAPAKRLRR